MFSLSGFAFQLMLLLYLHAELSPRALFLALGLLQLVHLALSAMQWPRKPFQPGDRLTMRGARLQVIAAPGASPEGTDAAADEQHEQHEQHEEKLGAARERRLSDLPPREQLLAPEFVYLCDLHHFLSRHLVLSDPAARVWLSGRTVFFSACAFVLRFYMGSVREQLLQGVHSNATAAAAEGGTSGVTVADVDQQVRRF